MEQTGKRIVVLCPTTLELDAVRDALEEDPVSQSLDLVWIISGMGAAATAHTVTKAINDHKPILMVQAGIAGVVPEKAGTFEIGQTTIVNSDYQADLGAWRPESDSFAPFMQPRVYCPYIKWLELDRLFPSVHGKSANMAGSPVIPQEEADIESMEGSAFFEVCHAEKVPFLQLRTISNVVGSPRNEWRIGQALESLAEGLKSLFGHLKEKSDELIPR